MFNSRTILLGLTVLCLTATCRHSYITNDYQGRLANQTLSTDDRKSAGHNQAKNPFADTIIQWHAINNTLTPQRVKDLMLLFDKKTTETYEFNISRETRNRLVGIRAGLRPYVPSEGQCTIVQKYLMEDSINFFLFAKKITPDSLYPVFFLSYPEARIVLFD